MAHTYCMCIITPSCTPCRPNPAYAPWFGVPLKAARVALAVIQALTQQARASRLSFTDVVKMLAATAPGSASFISKRVCEGA
jgi:DNA (cytosine-5)-methyltransferase 1